MSRTRSAVEHFGTWLLLQGEERKPATRLSCCQCEPSRASVVIAFSFSFFFSCSSSARRRKKSSNRIVMLSVCAAVKHISCNSFFFSAKRRMKTSNRLSSRQYVPSRASAEITRLCFLYFSFCPCKGKGENHQRAHRVVRVCRRELQ